MPVLLGFGLFVIALLSSISPKASASPPDVTYHRVIAPDIQREFYRSGGHLFLGKRVYLYVKSTVVTRKPEVLDVKGGKITGRYKNRSVPLLIRPSHKDLHRVLGSLTKTRWLSIQGRVIRDPIDRETNVISVDHIRQMPKSFKPEEESKKRKEASKKKKKRVSNK